MKIGINGINITGDKKKTLNKLVGLLEKKNIDVFVSQDLSKSFSNNIFPVYNKQNLSEFDFIISFGGDGTLLNTITHVGSSNTKILGVNIGKLGFLSYDVSDVFEKILDDLINKKYTLEKRSLVTISNKREIISDDFALNEISVIKKDSSSMIKIHC